MEKSLASTPTEKDLLRLIDDLREALEFDAEHCDFGPAYGIWESRRRKALQEARRLLISKNFKSFEWD
ncbi:hypothetical protein [Xanthomonas phage BUDD]|nr:hypothetical protein [Xanthomonas phage BUDD]